MLLWDVIGIALLLRAAGPDAAEHGTPDGMAGFALVELEAGIELQDLAEFLAARSLLVRDAVHEGEVLVSVDLVALEGQVLFDRSLQQPLGVLVLARLVGPDARGQVLLRGRPDGPGHGQHRPRA